MDSAYRASGRAIHPPLNLRIYVSLNLRICGGQICSICLSLIFAAMKIVLAEGKYPFRHLDYF